MPNVDRPIGFRPASGVGAPHQYRWFPVDSSSGTAFFVGDVVDHDGTGAVPAAANAGVSVLGAAVAFQDTNRIPVGHPLAAVSTKYLTASTAGWVLVALGIPGALFLAQGQSGQSPAQADIGATTDHVAGACDTTTHRSRHELNFSDLNTGAQFRIVGILEEPNNAWGEAHTDVYVSFNESQFNPSSTGV